MADGLKFPAAQSRAPLPLAPRTAAKPHATPRHSVGHHLDEVRKIILNIAFLGLVGLLVFAAARVLRSDDLMIDAIGMPKNIKELGYTEDGAALILSDNIRRIAEAAKSDGGLLTIKTNFDEQDISVPVEGLSFGSILRLLRQALGLPQNRLIGDFVCPTEPCITSNLEMRLRKLEGTGAPRPLATVKGPTPDAILQTAAERYMDEKAPMALSLYLYHSGPERKQEALDIAARLVRADDPEKLAALNLIGVELFERPGKKPEDLKQAINYFQQMAEEDPGIAMAYTNWGAALSALGDKAGAVEKYRKAIELNPGEAMQHHNLGAVLSDEGKDAEAVSAFERAIALNPDDPDSYVGLASSQLKLGKAAESLASYENAARLSPGNAGIQYSIGVAADQAGQRATARQAFESYLALSPDATDKVTVQGYIEQLSKP